MTQCEKILSHLREQGEITPMDADALYGVKNLAARISDLRAQGHHISGERVIGKNRFMETVHYSVYRLQEN